MTKILLFFFLNLTVATTPDKQFVSFVLFKKNNIIINKNIYFQKAKMKIESKFTLKLKHKHDQQPKIEKVINFIFRKQTKKNKQTLYWRQSCTRSAHKRTHENPTHIFCKINIIIMRNLWKFKLCFPLTNIKYVHVGQACAPVPATMYKHSRATHCRYVAPSRRGRRSAYVRSLPALRRYIDRTSEQANKSQYIYKKLNQNYLTGIEYVDVIE